MNKTWFTNTRWLKLISIQDKNVIYLFEKKAEVCDYTTYPWWIGVPTLLTNKLTTRFLFLLFILTSSFLLLILFGLVGVSLTELIFVMLSQWSVVLLLLLVFKFVLLLITFRPIVARLIWLISDTIKPFNFDSISLQYIFAQNIRNRRIWCLVLAYKIVKSYIDLDF